MAKIEDDCIKDIDAIKRQLNENFKFQADDYSSLEIGLVNKLKTLDKESINEMEKKYIIRYESLSKKLIRKLYSNLFPYLTLGLAAMLGLDSVYPHKDALSSIVIIVTIVFIVFAMGFITLHDSALNKESEDQCIFVKFVLDCIENHREEIFNSTDKNRPKVVPVHKKKGEGYVVYKN